MCLRQNSRHKQLMVSIAGKLYEIMKNSNDFGKIIQTSALIVSGKIR